MKAKQGIFIGPRAPFGYQKSELDRNKLVPDPVTSIVVRKIFELAYSGIGVNAIVRYLNEKEIPTPVQFARSNGLNENDNNGDESWNSRSVKYILTNRTYTGMLIQGKEKRVVAGTHEALVYVNVFDSIQKSFQTRAFNLAPKDQLTENLLKGKIICGCCGGKCSADVVLTMQIGIFLRVSLTIDWVYEDVKGCILGRKISLAQFITN